LNNDNEKGGIMDYISKENMIIHKLHLNPKGVLDLVKSMKEVTDKSESSIRLHEIIEIQVSSFYGKGKEMEAEVNSLKVYTDDLRCMTPDLTMQILNYCKDNWDNDVIPKSEDQLSYITKDVILRNLLEQYLPERDILLDEVSSKDFDKIIEGIEKDFKLENFQKTENTEKQGLSYEIKQPFIGNINGVFVGNAEVFYATINILQSIERTKNIPMYDEEFTHNLVEIIGKMSDKNDHFNYSEMLEATYANLTSSPTLKDFKIVEYYGHDPENENSPATLLNLMMKDGYYEYLKPKADIRINTSDKV
jgi:hypothetical protein